MWWRAQLLWAAVILTTRSVDAGYEGFHPTLAAKFRENSGDGLNAGEIRTLRQHGKAQSDKKPVRDVKRTGPRKETLLPIMMVITTMRCDACDKLRASINRGKEARFLLDDFEVVHLSAPLGAHKWCALGHESYAPQVYFYSRDGR